MEDLGDLPGSTRADALPEPATQSPPSVTIPIALSGETNTCESCGEKHPLEISISSEGCYYCPSCWDKWLSVFKACEHDWSPHHDEHGDPGSYCSKCAGFVNDEDMTAESEVSREARREASLPPRAEDTSSNIIPDTTVKGETL